MIKLIHRYKQSIGIVFLFVAFCFAISGVTVDVLSGQKSRRPYAVKVNDKEFSFADFKRAEMRLENQYKQMLGENYAKLAQSLSLNVPQQAVDNMIDGYLIEEQGRALGFAAGEAESNNYIVKAFSPARGGNGFSLEAYRSVLRQNGVSAAEFERDARGIIVQEAFRGLLSDVGFATSHDVKARILREETKYSFVAAEVSPDTVLSEVSTPSDVDAQKYYETNATDYELPARVSYDYIVFEPSNFTKEVSVLPADIEIFYADNQARFATPEEVRVRSIKFLYPKDPDPKRMADVRERAQKALEEANSQKPFESLVAIYSDDIPSKAVGGDRGWISKAKAPKEYGASVFDTPKGEIAALVEADYGFEVVKIEDKKPAGQRSLDEVRAEIEAEIRKREAPAYAAAKARELVAVAKKENRPLTEVELSAGLTASTTDGLLDDSKNPAATLSGLTRQVLQLPTAERLIPAVLDIGDSSVLVKVKEYQDISTAPFADVKEKVLTRMKLEAAKKLAEQRARELLDATKSTPERDIQKSAAEKKITVVGPFEITRANPSAAQFDSLTAEMRNDLLNTTTANTLLEKLYKGSKGFVVLQVTSISKPTETSSAEQRKFQSQASQEMARAMVESVLAQAKDKAQSTIDFDPGLLASR
jgi:peptidyl-prolyl cis-trans isomerase D